MKTVVTNRGFRVIAHPSCDSKERPEKKLLQESSRVGNYEHSMDIPGSSFLFVGDHHHLNREEVTQLRDALWEWLETGKLPLTSGKKEVEK